MPMWNLLKLIIENINFAYFLLQANGIAADGGGDEEDEW